MKHYSRTRADLTFSALGRSYLAGGIVIGYQATFVAEGVVKHPSEFDSDYQAGAFVAEQENTTYAATYTKQWPGSAGTELRSYCVRCWWPQAVRKLVARANRLRGVIPSLFRFRNLDIIDFGSSSVTTNNAITDFSGLTPRNHPKLLEFRVHGGSTGVIVHLDFTQVPGIKNVEAIEVNANQVSLGATSDLLTWESQGNKIPAHDFTLHQQITYIRTGTGNTAATGQVLPAGVNGSLLGVNYKIHLGELWCVNTAIPALDITGNITQHTLRCGWNKIADLSSITTISTMKRLYCNNNLLSALPIYTNLFLEELVCSNNQIPALNTRDHVNLRVYDCSWNRYASIDVTQNLVLRVLRCGNNTIPTIIVENNQLLQELDFEHNLVTFIDISMLPDLRNFNGSYNQLNSVIMSAPNVPKKFTSFSMRNQANTTGSISLDFSANTENMDLLVLTSGGINTLVLPIMANIIKYFAIGANPQLTDIPNFENQTFPDDPSLSTFEVSGCGLNWAFDLGGKIRSRIITIRDNAISAANMTSTINTFFSQRNNFNNLVNKLFNAAGSNAALPGGLLVNNMPVTGYAGSIHDQSEATLTAAAAGWTAKQKAWCLKYLKTSSAVNAPLRYRWTTFELN
jgi:hypothetical protein